MSKKSEKIAALIENCRGRELDAHYLGYFQCFNRQQFFESHEVLEALWLADRKGPQASFYKGLIQFAGAFVHLQKNRLKPAVSLFRLARSTLQSFPAVHNQLHVAALLELADDWIGEIEHGEFRVNPLATRPPPKLMLSPE